ncbi:MULTISPECIES: hypothetical protein [Bacillus]|uniref:hypothetical protein n=1 Tax=Bacillus TaxID=1386 RepID=UPI00077955CD|nr:MULTISPECIES: hypothetical protein [Bacillus]KYC75526.1 hypothetical protein B4090_2212 [Bacillus licheniformis]MBS2762950.1 hypothetical protein [Bacillus licheniformis]MEC2289328.1 hypothetical protein [Bacillus licheniformis]MED4325879.1 hypothetical protein [Bacillus licheniformis]MED4336362.1 hypothetical protein [Bacillus licheniformis]
MKRGILIWAVSAIVYLGLVIAGYSLYATVNPKTNEQTKHADHDQEKMDNQEGHQAHEDHSTNKASDVTPKVSYANGEITIELKDKNKHVPELEVSHEKQMHLIVVSSDLKKYYHLHPEKKNNGLYSLKHNLPDNAYKIFVDIKPKGLNYTVNPIKINVGKIHQKHNRNDLDMDLELTKTINGQTVELISQSFEANKEITLNFNVKDAKPDPYLGALGHVVILDEDGEKYIHVHPVADDKTVFKTQFNKPGVYKIWAEFKFGERVNVYPFVIEVKE